MSRLSFALPGTMRIVLGAALAEVLVGRHVELALLLLGVVAGEAVLLRIGATSLMKLTFLPPCPSTELGVAKTMASSARPKRRRRCNSRRSDSRTLRDSEK